MKVGDIVVPTSPRATLRSGCSWYDSAVCVSVDPFILVSEEADMRWSATIEIEKFKVIGHATDEVLNHCMSRLED